MGFLSPSFFQKGRTNHLHMDHFQMRILSNRPTGLSLHFHDFLWPNAEPREFRRHSQYFTSVIILKGTPMSV